MARAKKATSSHYDVAPGTSYKEEKLALDAKFRKGGNPAEYQERLRDLKAKHS